MAKRLALKFGHATPFRRTVTIKGEPSLLVFQPGEVQSLSAAEVKELANEVEAGLLVDPASDARFAKLEGLKPEAPTPEETPAEEAGDESS